MHTRFWQIQLMVVMFILLSACGQNQNNLSRNALIRTSNPDPVHIKKGQTKHVEQINSDVLSFPEIYDVAVVKGKKNTLVAYKVKHMHRFGMKGIEKKVKGLLKDKYPKEDFTVSSDYKIYLEAVRLNEDIKNKKISKKKAENRLNKIIGLTEEMT